MFPCLKLHASSVKPTFLAILLLGITALNAAPVVNNIAASQRPGTKLVDITYDLEAIGRIGVSVSLQVSSDAGATWTVPVVTVSGAIGTGLGIIGAEQTGPDFTTLRPQITATFIGSTVHIGWGWGGYGRHLDQCEIQVDHGSRWDLLGQDSMPGNTDTTPHPTAPAKWRHKTIYRVDDAQIGLWSAEASVAVVG
jgi:hypothetical protein